MRQISECRVSLPDGSSSQATHEGSVLLPGNLQINNVFFVPKLDCNLISVTKLLDRKIVSFKLLIHCVLYRIE